MPSLVSILLRCGPPALLIALILLADNPYSHSPSGVLLLSLCSLFVSLGFLLFGGQRFEA
ncbi:hypothetical protein [Pseudomonas sp. BMS12]|uniref:hypothetical protein n=1 Tax=Pseudomonas sp. BMS12 TaxID=1796033 RepID=UPI00083B076B|nr:hypothetical protein [Pseudomonas sp. BMS12]